MAKTFTSAMPSGMGKNTGPSVRPAGRQVDVGIADEQEAGLVLELRVGEA
jgi:hypothetical protein